MKKAAPPDQLCGSYMLCVVACFLFLVAACKQGAGKQQQDTSGTAGNPTAKLVSADTFVFNSFVDCNMATVWVKDTFKIFPGKYGEDPLWGEAHELKFASGKTVDEVFGSPSNA